MTEKISSQQLFLNSQFGLQRIYSVLNKEQLDGVSSEELSAYDNLALSDIPFVQFLQQNMKSIDTNSDDNISQDELNSTLSTIQSDGYTYEQLLSISASSDYNVGIDKSLLETVLSNFNEIDLNKDGRVSQSEIDYYSVNKEVADKKAELTEFKASDISIFYSDSAAEDTDNDSST